MAALDDVKDRLTGLPDEMRRVDPADRDSVARIGGAVEDIMDQIPGDRPALVGATGAILTSLQRVYLGEAPDASACVGAMADVVSAMAAWVDASGDDAADAALREACHALERSLAHDDEGPADADTCAESAQDGDATDVDLSLDDIAATLVGLTSEERDEAARLKQALEALAASGATSSEERSAMEEEARRLGEALADDGDVQAGLDAAGEALAQALEARPDPLASPIEAEMAPPSSESEREAHEEEEPAESTVAEAPSCTEASLLELETDPTEAERLNVVFRAFHTIKGTSGFLGLDRVQRLAHLAENMLDRARDGEVRIMGGYADLALVSTDMLKTMIEDLQGIEPGGVLSLPEGLDELLEDLSDPEAAGFSEEGGDGFDATPRVGDILVAEGKADREDVEVAARDQGGTPIGETLVKFGAAKAPDVAKALRTQKKIARAGASDATIRVSTGRLDNLVNMVGELVISQSMIAQDGVVTDSANHRLLRNVSHSGKIIREMQDLTMALRMVPLKSTFQKMARLVRDVARKSGKSVRFTTEGEDTEIDRNMVEVLNDPLVHMMRNAVDHGVESAEARRATGKGEQGTVHLRAYHSAGSVVIQISDDGKGLDRDRILAKGIERGVVEAGRNLTDAEVFGLIFQPGFSTAEKVTDVSGRGVGMDVVK